MIDLFSALSPEVQTALVSGVFAVLTAAVAGLTGLVHRQGKVMSEVRHQVKNSHDTNLRDDIDRIHGDVRSILVLSTQNARDIGGLRDDLRTERQDRIKADGELDHRIVVINTGPSAEVNQEGDA